MNGSEATAQIREIERERGNTKAHIIALTGLAGPEYREEAFRAGMDDFLTKPVSLKHLGELIDSWKRSTGGSDTTT
jgi:CheY-like chemotaxis protein